MRSRLGLRFFSLSFPRCFHRYLLSKISAMNSSAKPSGGTIDLRPVDSLSPAANLTDKVHLLPCCIRQDGPCPVSDYFRPQCTGVEVDGLKVQEAFFRGRRLQGTTVPVPDGYRGYLLCKRDPVNIKDRGGSEGEPNDWVARAEFQNITYWNHDDLPSQDDPILRCFHWFTIADAEGRTFLVKPLAFDIVWGGDPRYWSIPEKVKAKGSEPVELLRVSWLEATGSLSLRNFIKGQDYTISFMVSVKPDAFGWEESPVYLMAKPGEDKTRSWVTSNLGSHESGCTFFIPEEKVLSFKVPEDAKDDDKLLFGIYEIWKGRWKGGLVIHEVIITPV